MNKKLISFALALLSIFSVKAQFNNALHFDGSNDYVTAPVPTLFSSVANANFTIEFKIKPELFSTNRVFYLQTSTTNFVSVMLNSSGKIYFYTPSIGIATSNGIPLNVWTHVSIVKSGSTSEIYFDGVAQSSISGGNSSSSMVNLLGIGAKTDGSQFFKGVIDEFRIWDSVRSLSEITTNLNTELTLPQADLVTYYKFNQGIANGSNPNETSLVDNVNASNGTLINFGLSGTTSNWIGSLQLGLDESRFENKGYKIVPNPVVENMSVCGLNRTVGYELTNGIGQILLKGQISPENNKVKAQHLKPGIYFINVEGRLLKFIKQ